MDYLQTNESGKSMPMPTEMFTQTGEMLSILCHSEKCAILASTHSHRNLRKIILQEQREFNGMEAIPQCAGCSRCTQSHTHIHTAINLRWRIMQLENCHWIVMWCDMVCCVPIEPNGWSWQCQKKKSFAAQIAIVRMVRSMLMSFHWGKEINNNHIIHAQLWRAHYHFLCTEFSS